MVDKWSGVGPSDGDAKFVGLSGSPNGQVVIALFLFLREADVRIRWDQSSVDVNGNPYEHWGDIVTKGVINPYFLVRSGRGIEFKVRYVGSLGEVRVMDLTHPRGQGYIIVRSFPIEDPRCFDQVLEFVR